MNRSSDFTLSFKNFKEKNKTNYKEHNILYFTGEREKFSLPDDMPVMHFEYTQFYYPGNMEFPCKYSTYICTKGYKHNLLFICIFFCDINFQKNIQMVKLNLLCS